MSDTGQAQHQWNKPPGSMALTLEAWSQGLVIGALIIMTGITTANMRHGVLLHKLILIELLIAWPDCFFIFLEPPAFGWFLSSSSAFMILSWQVHNIVAWIKCKPFLRKDISHFYIATVALVQVYWVAEIYANFAYFNGINEHLFTYTRPYEALCRDPWWIFTVLNLFWNIRNRYEFTFFELIRISPRFAIMLLSMCLSILFVVFDALAVTSVLNIGGLNPFWKMSFVFKCFTDTIILDDFKTALDKLSVYRRSKMRVNFSFSDPEPASGPDIGGLRIQSGSAGLNGGPRSSSIHSHEGSPDIRRIDVDKIEAMGPVISPRSTFSGGTKGSSKEWWEHESYA